jgi:hypothetical protein
VNTHCNLLPRSLRRRRIVGDRVRRWATYVGLVSVGLAALACWHVREHVRVAARLDSARVRTARVREHVDRTTAHRARLADVHAQLAVRERIAPTEDTLHVLDLLGRGHHRAFGRLSVERLHVEREQVEGPSVPPGGESTRFERTTVAVTGLALDDAALSLFVTTLRQEAPSGRVELQSGSKVEVAGREVRRYVVECVFE